MTTVYAVFKGGIYRHECLGIFDDPTVAEGVADKAALLDPDHYHRYEVVPFEMDIITPLSTTGSGYYGPHYDEPEPIHTAK